MLCVFVVVIVGVTVMVMVIVRVMVLVVVIVGVTVLVVVIRGVTVLEVVVMVWVLVIFHRRSCGCGHVDYFGSWWWS